MTRWTRRRFLSVSGRGLGLGLLGAGGVAGCAASTKGDFAPKAGRRVVVIGGGWGGATAAKYVRLADPAVEVVMLEPNNEFVSCPFSNLVLSGVRTLDSITFGYKGLRDRRVRIIQETATAVEPDARRVRIGEGWLEYDRLIVSPGVEFQWEQVEGLTQNMDRVLHAWKAGPQTVELAKQLQAMPDGGVFVLSIPLAAYRCPPGPYERACQVAWYLKQQKPRAKLVVLDANQNVISKAALFRAAWQAYPNLEYRGSNKVVKVDPSVMTTVMSWYAGWMSFFTDLFPARCPGWRRLAVYSDAASARQARPGWTQAPRATPGLHVQEPGIGAAWNFAQVHSSTTIGDHAGYG